MLALNPGYRHFKTPSAYGKMVYQHLTSIYTSLEKEPPYRKGWLRLIKDICDYIKVNKGKKEVEEDEEESN